MDEKNKNAQDFNLTTPNIRAPNNPNRPPAPGGDQTMPNAPYPRDYGAPPPSSPRNAFDLTAVNFEAPGVEDDDEVIPPRPPQPQQFQPPPQQPPATYHQPAPAMAAPAPKRGVPVWAWLAGGGAILLLLLAAGGGALFYFYFMTDSAFTLKVLNAPAGSKVLVDEVDRSGVPQADGTIIIHGLRAGEPREVRVVHEGYQDFNTTVNGVSGQVSEITYPKGPKSGGPPPSEIDYAGKMMLVPAGPFTMGDDKRLPEEKPAHPVTLPAYYIDKFEVTNEQYKKFCEATGRATPTNPFWSPQYFESNPQMPVIGVSFADATAYAEWAGKRLPSEAEWEKAASWEAQEKRKRVWPWGDAAEASRANIGSQHPTAVGQYPSGASSYGVHDMAGNAQEWVDGFYQPYQGSTSRDPKFGNTLRVTRGGSFRGKPEDVRTTRRRYEDPSFRTKPEDAKMMLSSLIGFRCAVSADDPKLMTHLRQTKK